MSMFGGFICTPFMKAFTAGPHKFISGQDTEGKGDWCRLLFVNNPVFGCVLGFILRLFYREIVRDLIFGTQCIWGGDITACGFIGLVYGGVIVGSRD